MKKFIYTGVAMIAFAGLIAAGDQLSSAEALVTDNVMFIPVAYEKGNWFQTNEVQYAPCEPPSKPSLGNDADPLIRVFSVEGQRLYEQTMRNPRLVLIESPEEPVALLQDVAFELRLPYMRGAARVEFWESPKEQQEPSLVLQIDPNPDIPEKADCQVPEFVPDARAKQ